MWFICGFQLNLLSIIIINFISFTLSISILFIVSVFSEVMGRFPNIICFVLLKFSVSLFEPNQDYSFFISLPTVSRSCSRLSPQHNKFVSSANTTALSNVEMWRERETEEGEIKYLPALSHTNTGAAPRRTAVRLSPPNQVAAAGRVSS